MNSRRDFLKMASSAMLMPILSGTEKPKLRLAFSTLGCPKWDFKKILDFASQHGFAGVELRGLEGNLDLPSHSIFAPDRIGQTKQEIGASKLQIACVSSSANLYREDPAERAKEMKDAQRFIDLASRLGSPC